MFTRRVTSFLLISAIAASSSGGADAFKLKPLAQTIVTSKNAAPPSNLFDENSTNDFAVANTGVKSIRGGEEGDPSGIKKADVVKVHGLKCFLFAAIFFLDTLGVKIPLLGPEALIPGYSSGDVTTKYLVRFLCGLWTGLGMMELEFNESSAMQDIFTKYHIVLASLLLWTTVEVGGTGLHWFAPILVTLYGIINIVGN